MSTEFYLRKISESLEKLVKQGEQALLPSNYTPLPPPVVVDPTHTMGYQEPLKGPHTCKCGTTDLWCPTHGYLGPHTSVIKGHR